jgi:hypothetical protein
MRYRLIACSENKVILMSTTLQSNVHCATHPIIVLLVELVAKKGMRVSEILDLVDSFSHVQEEYLDTLEEMLARTSSPHRLCLDTNSDVFRTIHKYYGIRGISG